MLDRDGAEARYMALLQVRAQKWSKIGSCTVQLGDVAKILGIFRKIAEKVS